MTTTSATYRLKATNDFEVARGRIVWDTIRAVLLRRDHHLLSFNEIKPWLGQSRYRGVQEIPVQAIVGSVNRQHDFNRSFRPLHDTVANRWVQIHVLASEQGWSPIQVHQVGNLYFVEDGHHRVSVARHLQHKVIEAVVWDYNVEATFDLNISPAKLIAELKARQRPKVDRSPCGDGVCLSAC